MGVPAKETAGVDFGQIDVELVAFEFLQVVAANLGGLRGLANGDTFAFARFLEPFADGLHEMELGGLQRKGKPETEKLKN
jgi:hypothetical protein